MQSFCIVNKINGLSVMGIWKPQPGPQTAAIDAAYAVQELFFGGARGGGKTDFLLGDFLQDIWRCDAWKGIIFRRTYPELDEVLTRSKQLFQPLGAEYRVLPRTWTFPGGATLKLRHLASDDDADSYQGHQYTWIAFDELPQWPDDGAYKKLKACLRSAVSVENKRMRASGNPGGPGHQWVKQAFIDPDSRGYRPIETEDGIRMFIPSRVEDNRILLDNDPMYINRLHGVGSKELVRAWLKGDWSVVQGAYFDCWEDDRHVIDPFEIPDYWPRFRAMDWGSAAPFSVGWFTVSDGSVDGIAKDALVCYREWYGASSPNKGLRMTADEVARGIVQRERYDGKQEKIDYSVADPAIFAKDGGPSIANRMQKSAGIVWRRADNKRLPGWDQVRARLKGNEDSTPLLVFFDTCHDIIRTLPALQHDKNRAEDVDTDSEDHAGDMIRYACMSNPYAREQEPEPEEIARMPTFNELVEGQYPWSANYAA